MIYEEDLTDELIEQKIEKAKTRHKSLVERIMKGEILYDEDAYKESKHNTSKSKIN